MSAARFLPQRDYLGLKAAFRRLVELVGGSAEAGRISRVSQQAVERYGSANEDHEGRFAPLDVIADLEAACGQPIVTRRLAEMLGTVLVALPVAPGSVARLDLITGQALKEVADVFARLGEARLDGAICAAERAQLHREIIEAVTMLLKLDRQIGAEVEAEADDA